MKEIPVGKGRCLKEGTDVAVLSLGPIGNIVTQAINELASQNISIAHYDMRFLKPIDEEILSFVGTHFCRIITVEDGVRNGGLGSAVVEYMADRHLTPEIIRLGLPDYFVEHGTPEELYQIVGLDVESIKKAIL